MEKTDLKKVISVSGQPGLFRYVAQGKSGVILEAMATGNRTMFGITAKMTTLADVSVYTESAEVALKQLFENMKAKLSGGEAPSSKSDDKAIKAFFEEVLPEYDRDRFYLSHMKKVLDWYNNIQKYASLDFEEEESGEEIAENTDNAAATASQQEKSRKVSAAKSAGAAKATGAKAGAAKAAATKKSTKSVQRKAN